MSQDRRDFVIDIETVGDPDAGPVLELMLKRLKARGNLKDPVKIAADLEEKRAALVEKAALSPLTGKICAIGCAWRPASRRLGEDPWEEAIFTTERWDEGAMLEEFSALWHKAQELTKVVTWNGRMFDLPFLAARAAFHNMTFAWPLPAPKNYRDHFDLYDVFPEGGLGPWSQRILGRTKTGEGAEVGKMVAEGRWAELKSYCLDDVRLTAELFDRVNKVMR